MRSPENVASPAPHAPPSIMALASLNASAWSLANSSMLRGSRSSASLTPDVTIWAAPLAYISNSSLRPSAFHGGTPARTSSRLSVSSSISSTETSRPAAANTRLAWSRNETASGPLSPYALPSWPSSVSATAATSATSRASTMLNEASGTGE